MYYHRLKYLVSRSYFPISKIKCIRRWLVISSTLKSRRILCRFVFTINRLSSSRQNDLNCLLDEMKVRKYLSNSQAKLLKVINRSRLVMDIAFGVSEKVFWSELWLSGHRDSLQLVHRENKVPGV